MKTFLPAILLLSSLLTLTACGVSPEEKEQRRANAFDIAGSYSLGSNDMGETSLEIINEEDRSNVMAIVSRGGFSRQEEEAFKRQNINLNVLEKFRTRIQIGRGRHNSIEGGENISDNMGESSRVYLTTNDSESVHSGNDTIIYTVQAKISKQDFLLKGIIGMRIQHTEVSPDGKTTTISTTESIDIPFSATNNRAFFNQYAGEWSGRLFADNTEVSAALSSISLRTDNDTTYDVFTSRSSFVLSGETFTLKHPSRPVTDLSKVETPEIVLQFVGNKGTAIYMMGNIYSLGQYSGVIVKVNADKTTEQIGNFQFKRR